jgi:hypothetical protein
MRYLAAIAAMTLAMSITGTASAIPLGGSAGAVSGAQQEVRATAAYGPGDITLSASKRHAAQHGVMTISSPPLALPAPHDGGLSAFAIIVIAVGGSLAFTALGFAGGRRTSPRRALG